MSIYVSDAQLAQAEKLLRKDDKAIRLRFSIEDPRLIRLERKTFRGRIGRDTAAAWMGKPTPLANKDSIYRQEMGHVHVAQIADHLFNPLALREALREVDTWRRRKPLWARIEEEEEDRRGLARKSRTRDLRYKSSELFDRYSWLTKARVSVPVQVN